MARHHFNSQRVETIRSRGLADAGMLAVCTAILLSVLVASISRSKELANRAICSANVRGIIQSCFIYAQSNQSCFPAVMPPIKGFYENSPGDPRHGLGKDNIHVLHALYRPHGKLIRHARTIKAGQPLAFFGPGGHGYHSGSPLACLWVLILEGLDTPKSFLCPSDPIATVPSLEYAPHGNYYSNFGMAGPVPGRQGQGESYSIAFPWASTSVAPWWTDNDGSDVPVVSDMAPAMDKKAAGQFYRDPSEPLNNPVGPWVYNSGNHAGAGQNVGYGDDHVSWWVNPYCGQQNDNIFTWGARSQGKSGGHVLGMGKKVKAPTGLLLTPPFDIVMAPVRNVATGAW